ncbi:MAG: glycosyltransferase [bacterium]|nr:glycosyltransferase [Candidatus Sumerlaeota bacterium]
MSLVIDASRKYYIFTGKRLSMSGKIRIAYFITSLEVGGSERQLVALAGGLPGERFETHIICLSGYGALENEARAAGAALYDLRYPRLRGAGSIRWRNVPSAACTLWRLVRLLHALRPDILHTMIPVCNVLGMAGGKLAGIRRIVCTKLALGAYRDKCRLLPYLEDIADPHYTLVHCKSRGILEDVAVREPIPRGRMRIVYNGLRTDKFQHTADAGSVRAGLGLRPDARVIGMVANLIPYKGHAEVVSAAKIIVDEFPDAVFIFVGRDDGIGAALREQADKLGIGRSVVFAGERRDVADLLGAMDLLVCASHEEGFSNVLLESMASGLPVVATRVGGNPEAVEDGVTGVLVEPRQPRQLADAIARMLRDQAMARRMGAKGRERVNELFSYESMIKGMLTFYDEVMKT